MNETLSNVPDDVDPTDLCRVCGVYIDDGAGDGEPRRCWECGQAAKKQKAETKGAVTQ
jgi:hypothetical protein